MGKRKRNLDPNNERDEEKIRSNDFFWTVKTLKQISKNIREVDPQNLREVLAKSPHVVDTRACKSAILTATQLHREDLLHILIEAGALIWHSGEIVRERILAEDRDDSDSGSPPPFCTTFPDGGTFAFMTEVASLKHNKLNDELRSAGSAAAVKALVDAGAQPNYFGSYECTAVHEAAYSGKSVCLFALLQHGGKPFSRTAEGRTPLHAAAIGGNKTCVEILIKAGVNVTAPDYCSMTPLHFAAGSARSAACVPLLLAAGADVNGKDSFSMTPLHYAAAYGNAETVKLLLDEGADREALDRWHRAPRDVVFGECETRQRKEARATVYWLLNPAGGGDELTWENVAEDFIWDDVSPPNTNKFWRHDLEVLRQLACFGDVTLQEVRAILKRNTAIVSSYSACKALQTCAEIGKEAIIAAFMRKGANPNMRENDFCTDEIFEPSVDPGYLTCSCVDWPLIHIAAAAGQIQVIKALLVAKASKKRVWVADYPDPFGPVEAAAANGHLTVVKFLLISGCVTDREQLSGALRLAITPEGWDPSRKNWDEMKQLRVARTLLDAGADPNAQDVFGHTPILGAAFSGWTKCLSLLIRRGSNVLAKTHSGKTPLHAAAQGGHTNCVCLLLDAGANVFSKDSLGQTPLHYVAEGWSDNKWAYAPLREGATETVIALLNAGADINSQDGNGATALHLAAESGNCAVVEALLNASACINAKDRNGRTPLHYAADARFDLVLKMLLNAGADQDVKDRSGHTPRVCVEQNPASSLGSIVKNGGNLENKDDDRSECSWCGISSDDEWIEESSEDDTSDWEQEYHQWIKELQKQTSQGDEIVKSQLEKNMKAEPNVEEQSIPNILPQPGEDVKTESENDDVWDDSEESEDDDQVELNKKWLCHWFNEDSESDIESLPNKVVPNHDLQLDDPNAPWYKKRWNKATSLDKTASSSQRSSEMDMQSTETRKLQHKIEANFCSKLEDTSPSISDYDTRGKVEIEKHMGGTLEENDDSVQTLQVPSSEQDRGNERNNLTNDEHEGCTQEFRIKVELDVDMKEETPDKWNASYSSAAWTRPHQNERDASEKNDSQNKMGKKQEKSSEWNASYRSGACTKPYQSSKEMSKENNSQNRIEMKQENSSEWTTSYTSGAWTRLHQSSKDASEENFTQNRIEIKQETSSEWTTPYTSGAWTTPHQSSKDASEENETQDRIGMKQETSREWTTQCTSGAWTRPQQSSKNASEENETQGRIGKKQVTSSEQTTLYSSGAGTISHQRAEDINNEKNRLNRTGDNWFVGGSICGFGNQTESIAADGVDGDVSLQEREELSLGERKRRSVWYRLGERSSERYIDGHHNNIIVTRILNADAGQTVRYVQENSSDGYEQDARSEQDGKEMFINQRRFTGGNEKWEKYGNHELYQSHVNERQGTWNEGHSMHQEDENYNINEHGWVRQSYISNEQLERIVYVQDDTEVCQMNNMWNISDELQKGDESQARDWCERNTCWEEQRSIGSDIIGVQEKSQGRKKDSKEKIYSKSHGGERGQKRHDGEKLNYSVNIERGQDYGKRQEEDELETESFHSRSRYSPQKEMRDKYLDLDGEAGNKSIGRQGEGRERSKESGGQNREQSHCRYDRGKNSRHRECSGSHADWKREEQFDKQRREKRHRSREREDYVSRTRRGFRQRVREEGEMGDYEREEQVKRRKVSQEEEMRLLRTHKQAVDGGRKSGDDQDSFHHRVISSEKVHVRSHSEYMLYKRDQVRSHSQYSVLEERGYNMLHRHHQSVEKEQDRTRSQYCNPDQQGSMGLYCDSRSREREHNRARRRFSEEEHDRSREQTRDRSDSRYSGRECEKYRQYRLREHAREGSRSSSSRFKVQEHDICNSQFSGQEDETDSQHRLREHGYDRSYSPHRRLHEVHNTLRQCISRKQEHERERSRSRHSGSGKRNNRSHKQHIWPDLLQDVPH